MYWDGKPILVECLQEQQMTTLERHAFAFWISSTEAK